MGEFVELGDKKYNFATFKVVHLKDYICNRKNVADSDKHDVKLWKVNVIDENDVKEKLKEDAMKLQKLFRLFSI
jgi:hypothetical protein